MPVSPSCRARLAAAAAALVLGGAGNAQETEPFVLDTISVEASGGTEGTGSYVMTAPTATATGLPLTVLETPQSVSIVTQQQILDQTLLTLQDALAATSGLSTSQANGQGRWRFFARGSEVTNLQFDGIPVRQAWWGQDANANATATLDRIEVVRGATGLLEGVGTPSASVNLVRKRPTFDPFLETEASVSSEGNASLTLDGAGPLNEAGTVRGRLVGYGQAGDTFIDDQTMRNGLVYGAIDADLGDRTTAGVGLMVQKDHVDGYPWGGFWTRPDGSFYDFAPSDQPALDWEYVDRTQTVGYADIEHRLDNGWTLRAAARYALTETDQLSSYAYWTEAETLYRDGVDYDMTEETFAADLRAAGTIGLFGRSHDVAFGANGQRTTARYDALSYGLDIADPARTDPFEHPRPAIAADAAAWSTDDTVSQWGLYGTARLNLSDRLKVIGGGRLTWYRERDSYVEPAYDIDVTVPNDAEAVFLPYVGALYDLTPDWTVYASYTEIFEPQDEIGLDGGSLDPVRGTNVEAGIKGMLLGDRLLVAAALFSTEQDGLPVAVEDATLCLIPANGCYLAGERVTTRGFDLEATGAITDRWDVMIGYSHARAEFTEGPNDGQAYGTDTTPLNLLKAATTYRLAGALEGWTVGGSVLAQSALTAEGVGWLSGIPYAIRQPGVAVFDAMTRYQLRDDTEIQLNVTNLFDRTWYSSIGDSGSGNWLAQPRTVSLTLRHTF